ncbi:MAG: hypothetical protein ACLROG_20800 [Coprococcus phoceensis]
MNTHANELKNCLLKIIDEMALSSDIFNLSGKPAFCRKSKFNFFYVDSIYSFFWKQQSWT